MSFLINKNPFYSTYEINVLIFHRIYIFKLKPFFRKLENDHVFQSQIHQFRSLGWFGPVPNEHTYKCSLVSPSLPPPPLFLSSIPSSTTSFPILSGRVSFCLCIMGDTQNLVFPTCTRWEHVIQNNNNNKKLV